MSKLGVVYATALFEIADESGLMDQYLEQAIILREAIGDDECQRIILHPHISSGEKREFLHNIFADNINEDLMGFMRLAIEKNRESFLKEAFDNLIGMINQRKRKVTASVVSAVEPSQGQLDALKALLSKKLDKEVDISVKIDPSVIGGIYIQVDGFFIDHTVKRQLSDMKMSFKEHLT
jgi:F-type H+-transporting ATPase subunit delta